MGWRSPRNELSNLGLVKKPINLESKGYGNLEQPINFCLLYSLLGFPLFICLPNFALVCYCKQLESTRALWEHANAKYRPSRANSVRLTCPKTYKNYEITFGWHVSDTFIQSTCISSPRVKKKKKNQWPLCHSTIV